jgi:hypothetical protein
MNENISNKIFVIDSNTTALMVSLIAQDKPIRCVYEIKEGLSNKTHNGLFDLILSENIIIEKKIIKVQPKYFLLNKKHIIKSVLNLIKFRRKHHHIKIEKDFYYVGPSTSTIMAYVDKNKKYYLDHGTGDYYARLLPNKNTSRNYFLNKFFIYLGFPEIFSEFRKKGYSLCQINNDRFFHLDVVNYHIPKEIKIGLNKIKNKTENFTKISLLLPVSSWHNKNGIDGNSSKYDDLNIQMCQNNFTKDELILVKFHPSLFMADKVNITLIDKLKLLGYSAIIVDEYLPDDLSYFLPAEILVLHLGITKIVSEESSLLFNLTHLSDIKLIAEPYIFNIPCERDNRLIKIIDVINPYLNNPITIGKNEIAIDKVCR